MATDKRLRARDYSDDWSEISDRICFKRANGRCECRGECGVSHGRGKRSRARCKEVHGAAHTETGLCVTLQTAHLDHDKSNNADSNLRAFCEQCHGRYDAKHNHRVVRERLRRLKAHSELPYLDGF